MPILDPSLQYFLLNNSKHISGNNGYSFFLKYLLNASHNIYQNSSTIETSIQFRKDLQASISFVNDEFGCTFTNEDDFENQKINDYYKYLYEKIKKSTQLNESKKSVGVYKIATDKFNTKLYQPSIFFSEYYSWYLSDTPISILCLNSQKFKLLKGNEEIKNKIFKFIKLEIDLMKAAGLTLVLCYNGSKNTKSLLYKIIEDDQFSELHINIFNANFLNDFLDFIEDRFISKKILLKGYIYIYSNSQYMDRLLRIPRVEVITFSKKPKDALINVDFLPTKPFPYYKTGFNCKYLRIYLSFVPIYNKNRKKNTQQVFTNKISGLSLCYIYPSDFLFLENRQVSALFDDENHHHSYCLLNFEDIHYVRPDLFVKDTLYLMPMESQMHSSIELVHSKVSEKFEQVNNLQKRYIHHISFKHYLKCIRRVVYAYTYLKRQKNKDFKVYNTQIYAVLEACKSFFVNDEEKSNENKTKGVVYEVKTGEGKSCIVSLIAAVLAIKNITVHIASSNIKLCIRDYLDSYEFFKLLKLEPAVLLHKFELPTYNDEKFNNEKFFGDELFNNTSRMNFSVCGLDNDNNDIASRKANIIFSTFVNFESFYLHLMDNCPGYIEKYFNGCGLLIDEADSILIDEITTGTIVSREINSNAKEVLSYVYNNRNTKSPTEIYEYINEIFKFEKDDFSVKDVEKMFQEIDLVNQKQFQEGKKYIIETFTVKNKQRILNLLKKTVNNIMNIKDVVKDNIKDFLTDIFLGGNDEDNDEDKKKDEEELDTNKTKQFSRIVPFDYDHKGIPEPNKEFSGFIQQFISLKENKKDLIFRNISISYLYISHPIFANLYRNIFGLTGTIGNENDKTILYNQYKLITKKIPRHKPNLRVDLPMIVCSGISERNDKIVSDILSFHKKGNPVLVIFQDFNEIDGVERTLYSKKKEIKVNVFNGKDDIIKPDFIAGDIGAISLGTNICGRGTDIKCSSSSFPLHVIISYYTSNTRVMEQAFGRTARNGQIGTCRCICLKKELLKITSLNPNKIESIISEADLKSTKQKDFIEYYKNQRPWIFEFKIKKDDYKKREHIEKLKQLRNIRINVNRIVAYKYSFPIFMSYNTFLKIQAQKCFSVFNCPNCKYSWRIFQRYIREMILQSWSLMIKKFDQENDDDNIGEIKNITQYEKKLDKEIDKLKSSLEIYLPNNEYTLDMVSTFYHICNCVKDLYEDKILNSFGNSKYVFKRFFGNTSCTCIQLGFRPYSLFSYSGARIAKDNVDETNFIKDPELSYEKKCPDNKITLLSITERIDDIFNLIFQKISSFLGENYFLKFFLRRTLAGCEFGVCFDMILSNGNLDSEQNILIDKNPLLVATIYLYSIFPLLAGILICALVYVAYMSKEIMEYITGFPAKVAEKFAKKSIVTIINKFIPNAGEFVFMKIFNFLDKCLCKQIEKLGEFNVEAKEIIENLRNLFQTGENFSETVSGLFKGSFSIPSVFGLEVGKFLNGKYIMLISIHVILLLAAFLINFIKHKNRIKQSKSDSKEFDSTYDDKDRKETEDKLASISNKKEKQINGKVHLKNMSTEEENEFNTLLENFINSEKVDLIPPEMKIDNKKSKSKKNKKSEIYCFENIYRSKYELNLADISEDPQNGNKCFHIPSRTLCRKVYFDVSKEFFDYISFFSSYNHPVIVKFIGYAINCDRSFLLFQTFSQKGKFGYLSDFPNKKFPTMEDGLIFAYCISCGIEFLQKHNIDIHNFNPNHVVMNDFSPIIFGIFLGEETANSKYLAPELVKDPDSYSIKNNVFSLGIMLYIMSVRFVCDINIFLNDESDFSSIFSNELCFDTSFDKNWYDLVFQCLDVDIDKRLTFSDVCNNIESNYKDIYAIKRLISIFEPYRKSFE